MSTPSVKIVPINPHIVISGDVVGSARKLIGRPYVWGGNYPPLGNDLGTDCSGLCMWAYNDQGLLETVGIVGRWTTYTMYAKATIIPINEAQPGDVLFTSWDSNGQPGHVMMIAFINIERITVIEAQRTGTNILERTIDYNTTQHKIGRLNNNA